jgi:non-ribosomal peptide synthetase component F
VSSLVCRNKLPIGIPLSNNVIYLLDGQRRPVEVGQIGEIFVAGKNLADGYVARESSGADGRLVLDKKTAAKFQPNPFVTADTGIYTTFIYNKIDKNKKRKKRKKEEKKREEKKK